MGAGQGPGGGHKGGGTCVDNQPVDKDIGTEIKPGCIIRFGINELWMLERAAMQQRSQLAEIQCRRAARNTYEDPTSIRDLRVPSFVCVSYLHGCKDWLSLVRVVLETRHEPDEAPCVDCIEVLDECGKSVGRHECSSWEEQQGYDVRKITKEIRLET